MKYRLEIQRAAEKDMRNLPDDVLKRVTSKILGLTEDPYQRGAKKLQGRSIFRVKVGVYRILYAVNDRSQTLTITGVRHRREAYR